jgi:hypothetical protein
MDNPHHKQLISKCYCTKIDIIQQFIRALRFRRLYIFVEPPELLPQHVFYALPCLVAVVLEGQQHQPGSSARTPHGFEEDLGLEREGTRVGVVVTVNDQYRLIYLVGEESRRDLDVDIPRLEKGTALGLEAERLVGFIV